MKLLTIVFICLATVAHAAEPNYLSKVEQDVLTELNLARTQPQKYVMFLENLKQRYDTKKNYRRGGVLVRTIEGVKAVDEAIAELKKQKRLKPLSPARGMSAAAEEHASDQAKTGKTGHTGSDGSDMSQRIERHGRWLFSIGENISYGNGVARDMVLQLIVDDGVPDRGHRKNIFNKDYNVLGVAVDKHPKYGQICVTTFADGFKDK